MQALGHKIVQLWREFSITIRVRTVDSLATIDVVDRCAQVFLVDELLQHVSNSSASPPDIIHVKA